MNRDLSNIEVNYKNKKKYNTARTPAHQSLFWMGLIWILSKFALMGKKYKIEKINMDGLRGPYLLLSNHMCFIDFELASLATFPQGVNNVVNIDGYYHRPFIMEWIGCIATRKFTTDLHLVRAIHQVLERGDVLCMYPEARYSPCGVTSYMPEALGALAKRNKVPVVTILHRGNYLHSPFWDFRRKRKVPFHTTITQILTAEQVAEMSVEDINSAIKEALTYDEYKYQRENGIRITEPYRAEGLHRVLYKCPNCMAESVMDSAGAEIFCGKCGKRWTMNEDGTLTANEGETEFSHIPDWFAWERRTVEEEIERGEYHFEDDVDVYSLPRCWKFENLGHAKLIHDINDGFIIEGEYNGKVYRVHRAPLQINSLHIEYDYFRIRRADCLDISTENDSFYCYPTKENVVTKLAFATEIIYLKALNEKRKH